MHINLYTFPYLYELYNHISFSTLFIFLYDKIKYKEEGAPYVESTTS
jgi:hypothetical protein